MPEFRWILHLDLDQFLAAVELQRHPELRGRPIVVGGDGDPQRRRQVVSTASAEARGFGIHSGMPLRTAQRRCPDAVFLPLDHAAYDNASAAVWSAVRTLPATVEVWGWDEGFLGSNTADPWVLARQARHEVRARTGLTCCVGIGENKLMAKLATGLAKAPAGVDPQQAPGVAMLTRETWDEEMGNKPPDALWGIGARTAARLAADGIRTVGELAASDDSELAERFGPTTGPWLRRVARGAGDRQVSDEPWVPRGRSHEETYPEDLHDRGTIEGHLRHLARRVTHEAAAEDRLIRRVSIKVRFVPFTTATRVTTLSTATSDPAVVAEAAVSLLGRFDDLRPIRLLGVRVEFVPPEEPARQPAEPPGDV